MDHIWCMTTKIDTKKDKTRLGSGSSQFRYRRNRKPKGIYLNQRAHWTQALATHSILSCTINMFSFKDGFVEALTRGRKAELLQAEDYCKLKQCDTVSDLRLYLVIWNSSPSVILSVIVFIQVSKCYKDVLQNELDVVDPTDLVKLCTDKFVSNFKQLVSMVLKCFANSTIPGLNHVCCRHLNLSQLFLTTSSMVSWLIM
jgi:hypothetical protein